MSWTTDGTATTTGKPTQLPCMLPESSIQLAQSNAKQSIALEDAQISQDAQDGLASLLEVEFNSIISVSPVDVGRTNLFQMDIPMAGLLAVHKPHPILFKVSDIC